MLNATDKSTCETVRTIDWWTDDLFRITISRPAAYRFTPGQFSRLGLGDPASPAGVVWRAYSVTSHPDADHLEYYGVTVPGGAFTGAVGHMRAGDPILLEKSPNGFLTVDRFTGGTDLWMLATGTGLGPFISILRDAAVWQRFDDVVLVHCVRQANELAYASELDQMAATAAEKPAAARLHLVRTTTRDAVPAFKYGAEQQPQAGGQGDLHGRITTLLQDGTLERATGIAQTTEFSRIMLCGNPAMIDETRKLLQQRGFLPCRRAVPGHFLTENYW